MQKFTTSALEAMREVWPVAATQQVSEADFELLVDDVTDAVIDSRKDGLQPLFVRMASPTPTVVWEPDHETLGPHPRLDFLQRFWNSRRRGTELPLSSTIDPIELAPAFGFIMLLQPMAEREDFLYRVYGTAIAEQSRLEMTGNSVREIPVPLVAVYFLATYRAAMFERRPVFVHHLTDHDIQIARWDRLILPFVNPDGHIDRLLVGNVPGLR